MFDRLWGLLEGACTELDLLLAEHESVGCVGNTYSEYVEALKRREQLKASCTIEEQRATMLEQLVTYFSIKLPDPASNQPLCILRLKDQAQCYFSGT